MPKIHKTIDSFQTAFSSASLSVTDYITGSPCLSACHRVWLIDWESLPYKQECTLQVRSHTQVMLPWNRDWALIACH